MNVFAVKKEAILQLWWIMVLFGLVLFAIGGYTLFYLSEEHFIESALFSIVMLISGLLEVLFAVRNKRVVDNWEWYFVNGVIDFLIGVLTVWMPEMNHTNFSFLMSFWLLFRGLSFFSIVFTTKIKGSPDWIWLLLIAVFAILNAVCLIVLPIAYGVSVDTMNSLTIVMFGLTRLTIGIRIRNLNVLYIKFSYRFKSQRRRFVDNLNKKVTP